MRSKGNSNNDSGSDAHAKRVVASLNREQIDFLDKIGKDAQFSSGLKLSRTQILAAMVNALKHLDLSGEGVSSSEQFERRIVETLLNGKTGEHTDESTQ